MTTPVREVERSAREGVAGRRGESAPGPLPHAAEDGPVMPTDAPPAPAVRSETAALYAARAGAPPQPSTETLIARIERAGPAALDDHELLGLVGIDINAATLAAAGGLRELLDDPDDMLRVVLLAPENRARVHALHELHARWMEARLRRDVHWGVVLAARCAVRSGDLADVWCVWWLRFHCNHCDDMAPAVPHNRDTSFRYHRFQIAVAHRVPAVPSHRPEHDHPPKVAPREVVHALTPRYSPRDRSPSGPNFATEPSTRPAPRWANDALDARHKRALMELLEFDPSQREELVGLGEDDKFTTPVEDARPAQSNILGTGNPEPAS